jgi:hypothetical protein
MSLVFPLLTEGFVGSTVVSAEAGPANPKAVISNTTE